jgi:cytidylate kinase
MRQKRKIKPINKAIVICGRIGSGKTTLAKKIAEMQDVPIASFGGFIKHYCEEKGVATNRKILQDVGAELVKNPKKLIKDVIAFYKKDSSNIILEGYDILKS